MSEIRTELLLKRGALVGAEPSHAAGLGNAEPLHDLLGADLADAATQTRHILEIIRETLAKAGARLEDVVRTRMYLTDVDDWEAVGKAHGEFFGAIRPAATMVVVAGLLQPTWRVEIEADAVVHSAPHD